MDGICAHVQRCLFWLLLIFTIQLLSIEKAIAAGTCPVVDSTGQPACGDSIDIGSSAPNGETTSHVGNPIDVVSGNKYQSDVDIRFGGSALSFVRHYNSLQHTTNVGLGNGWRHSYSVVLSKSGSSNLEIAQSDGRLISFTLQDGVFQAWDEGDGYIERADGNKHVWHLVDGRQFTFYGSYLVQIKFPYGGFLDLQYRSGRLESVRDELDRSIEFLYESGSVGLPSYKGTQGDILAPPGHMLAVLLPNKMRIEFGYDEQQNLVTTAYPNADPISSGYVYQYRDENNPRHLTERSLANGRVLGRWTYDERGRAISYRSSFRIGVVGLENGYPDLTLTYRVSKKEGTGSTTVYESSSKKTEYRWNSDINGYPNEIAVSSVGSHVDNLDVISENTNKSSKSEISDSLNIAPIKTHNSKFSLSVFSIDELGYPDIVNYSSSNYVEPHRMKVSYDRVGNLKSARWLSGELNTSVDGQKIRNIAELDKVIKSLGINLQGAVETHSALSEVIKIVEDSEALLTKTDTRLTKYGVFKDKLIPKEIDIEKLDQSSNQNDVISKLRKISSNGSQCINPLTNCDSLSELKDYAELSRCVYLDDMSPCTSRFNEVTLSDLGLLLDDIVNGSFRSEIYYDQSNNRYIVSFAGTDPTSIGDLRNNIRQEFGQSSFQHRWAVRLARKLRLMNPNADIKFTGHSLGGGLATAAAAAISAEATVFNPAALDRESARILGISYSNAYVNTNVFSVDGDILHELQTQVDVIDLPVGNFNTLPAPNYSWIRGILGDGGALTYRSRRGFLLHGMNAVIQAIADLISTNKCVP